MLSPRKYDDNPVAPRGDEGAPDAFGLQFYGSIILDDGTYRMWYIALDDNLNSSDPAERVFSVRPAYAESDDGIIWRKNTPLAIACGLMPMSFLASARA